MTRAKTKTKASRKSSAKAPDRATAYALAVEAGEIVAGPLVRAACSRHLADLKRPASHGLVWSLEAVERSIRFFERVLRLNGGEHEGEPFLLKPWQAFVVGSLFGWLTADGSRRFQTAYIEAAKGNGKSPLLAGIGLYGLVADGEPRAEIYAAATKRDQAQILFRDAVAMVELSPVLSAQVRKSGGTPVWNLAHERSGSWFRPISSEDNQSGPRPHMALVDEVHEHKSATVIDMLRAGFKGRRQPLQIEITNSGVDRGSICYQHHEYTERVVTGLQEDDAWFGLIFALDDDDEPFEDEACWIKANPNLGVSVSLKYLRGQVREAKGMPAKASIVRRLNFCQWVDAENPAIDGELWRSAAHGFDPVELAGVEPLAALDLSGVRDLTALALLWPGELAHARVEFWTPKEGLLDRAKRDRVPYDLWVREGHVTATPGRSVDYAFVAVRLGELQAEFGLRRLAFDAYRIKYLERELDALGIELELVPHGQGFYKAAESGLWMPHSIELLEERLGKGSLLIHPNPALNFAAASAVTEADAKGNRIFTKRKSKGRIDGLVALAMVVGLAGEAGAGEGESFWETEAAARARFAEAVAYVRNAGSGATRAGFLEDFEPVGAQLLEEAIAAGVIVEVDGALAIPAGA